MSLTPEPGPAYLSMPSTVAQYVPPLLPEDTALRSAGAQWLERMAAALESWRADAPGMVLDLRGASPEGLRFLKEVLGAGEVSALAMGNPDLQVEETVFAGLWRVRGEGVDYLEAADIPAILRRRAVAGQLALPDPADLPGDLVNAPHVFAEILARHDAFERSGAAHVFNFDLVPMSDADLGWLVRMLGEGPVVIVSSGYGACRVRSTGLNGAWWVQFSNASDILILNTLEICAVPAVACAAPEDIADSARRIRALGAAYG
ncbi:hydrogenase expression/formation C-terminal domain-containing protein [Acidocella sp.]|uniref:hydrogenase expression/formation protein n=1 Tax=Acidocella sp. TaxID=50710 RepID=UPI003D045DED